MEKFIIHTLFLACSDFKAISTVRSQTENSGRDEKGFFESVCRHDTPLKFIDLKHGEK